MGIKEQVARELCRMETGCGVHWDECIEDGQKEIYLVKADQIIPLVRADIAKWGNEECFEHPYNSKLKHEEYNRKRHRCPECWKSISGTFKEIGGIDE